VSMASCGLFKARAVSGVFGIPPRVIFRHCIFSDPQISSGSVGFGIAFSVIFRH
jgi:hypothetical protein